MPHARPQSAQGGTPRQCAPYPQTLSLDGETRVARLIFIGSTIQPTLQQNLTEYRGSITLYSVYSVYSVARIVENYAYFLVESISIANGRVLCVNPFLMLKHMNT